jgi:hypothetical protein
MKEHLFEERQYIGYNKHTLSLRLFLAIFCFVAYYFTDIPEVNGDLLFFLGIAILLISLILLFVTHIHTVINPQEIIIEGIMHSGKTRVPVNEMIKAEVTPYSRYIINYPVFNLHRNGSIRFYTGGRTAVRIYLKNDTTILLGSRKAQEMARVINELTSGKIG